MYPDARKLEYCSLCSPLPSDRINMAEPGKSFSALAFSHRHLSPTKRSLPRKEARASKASPETVNRRKTREGIRGRGLAIRVVGLKTIFIDGHFKERFFFSILFSPHHPVERKLFLGKGSCCVFGGKM